MDPIIPFGVFAIFFGLVVIAWSKDLARRIEDTSPAIAIVVGGLSVCGGVFLLWQMFQP
jgi:hypothetical protein